MQILKDVMTHDVMVISPDATIEEAASRMRSAGFGMMPVEEGDRMIGVISDRDIVMRAIAEGKGCDTLVRHVMSPGVNWAYEEDTIEQGARMMGQFQVRRLPIVDSNKRLVGIVSLGDFALEGQDIRAVASTLTDISRP